jgi:nucleoside-diphosphate kinase
MAREMTLAIVKPDAVKRNLIGEVIRRIEQSGLQVAAGRFLRLSKTDAEGFYAVHRERPFFGSLVEYCARDPSWSWRSRATTRSSVGAT